MEGMPFLSNTALIGLLTVATGAFVKAVHMVGSEIAIGVKILVARTVKLMDALEADMKATRTEVAALREGVSRGASSIERIERIALRRARKLEGRVDKVEKILETADLS